MRRLALLFPAVEFAAGVGLLIPGTRRGAAVLVMAMHVCLIAILGPWNLNHSLGVLLWNLLLLAQAYLLLFQKPVLTSSPKSSETLSASSTPRLVLGLVRVIVVIAILAPLLERRGYWDHWTSWSLYSPHTSYVDVEIHQSAIERLSPTLTECLESDTNGDGWALVDLGRWSLKTQGVPIYPQARYQLGLADAIASRYQLNDEIRARFSGVADRLSGQRERQMMGNRREIEAAAQQFWMLPRKPATTRETGITGGPRSD